MSREQNHPKLVIPREEAERRLMERIAKGDDILEPIQFNVTEVGLKQAASIYTQWSDFNEELLGRIFDGEQYLREYRDIDVMTENEYGVNIAYWNNFFRNGVAKKVNKITSIVAGLELIPVSLNASLAEYESAIPLALGSDVFVVHGSDDGTRETVARFIGKLGLKPVILREQPNSGRTIIEKFEDYSNVGFAVVLMTPDDVGKRKDQQDGLEPRARQNVILELGFFLGKLGRNRVCALYKPGVEIPSDYSGVGYVLLDEHDAWHLKLAKEIRSAGLPVDMNKMME